MAQKNKLGLVAIEADFESKQRSQFQNMATVCWWNVSVVPEIVRFVPDQDVKPEGTTKAALAHVRKQQAYFKIIGSI